MLHGGGETTDATVASSTGASGKLSQLKLQPGLKLKNKSQDIKALIYQCF